MWSTIGFALDWHSIDPNVKRAKLVASNVVLDWGRPGDNGMISFEGETFAGAAWSRQYKVGEVPGAVEKEIPALAIGILPTYRNLGIGTRLLERLVEVVKLDGVEGLTLGVERANTPARRFYESFGFSYLDRSDGSLMMTMKLDF